MMTTLLIPPELLRTAPTARPRLPTDSLSQSAQSQLHEKYWTIIGHGSIGAKAEELMQKTDAILEAGFTANPRVVLSMGFFDNFRERNGITAALAEGASGEQLRHLVYTASFDESELEIIRAISNQFNGIPLAIRSSAHGDCRGTGVYESTFRVNNRSENENTIELVNAIKEVLLSEFSDVAIAFREDLSLQNGIAVMIEPIFGQVFIGGYGPDKKYGPLYGGLAYTSTSYGEGYAVVCGGLPTNAVQGKGLKVRENDERSIEEVLAGSGNAGADLFTKLALDEALINGDAIDLVDGFKVSDHLPTNGLFSQNMSWLFERLNHLEAALGKPQYVEWAVIDHDGNIEVAILQIADVDLKTDFYEFPETEKLLVRSNFLSTGNGQVTCKSIVVVSDPKDIPLLREYNKTHRDYIVIYPNTLSSRPSTTNSHGALTYADLNNAMVLVELPSSLVHIMDPAAHFEGLLETTGKILLVTDRVDWDKLAPFKQVDVKGDGKLEIYSVTVKVTASERQQKAIVELVDSAG